MPHDIQGLADTVVLTCKAALAPTQERIAVLERVIVDLREALAQQAMLRDRVVTLETLSAQQTLREQTLIDRIATLDTKAALVGPSGPPGPPGPAGRDGVDGLPGAAGKDGLDGRHGADGAAGPAGRDGVDGPPGAAGKDGLDGRHGADGAAGPVGPSGRDGSDGIAGLAGKDGVDGLGFGDLDVRFDGDRTITIHADREGHHKSWPIVLPYLKYLGVYRDAQAYQEGDVVTWAGSTWVAHRETTTKPGDGSKDWQLCVRKGRDGRDGIDAGPHVPVIRSGGGNGA